MAKTKTIPSPGNAFQYYVPRRTSGSSVPSKATPTSVSSPSAKPKYIKPWTFIKNNFVVTNKVPFGSKGVLTSHFVIRDIDIVRASLECGYGRRSEWTSALALSPREAIELSKYLLMRLQMVIACIQADKNQAKIPRSFYTRVEASEKVALSFIIGGIGTYLAAQNWLQAGDDSVGAFLHTGIYTKGIDEASPLVHFTTASGKSPDYLVESRKGQWHVFESKGGNGAGRWGRIVEGLVQLADLPKIAWAGKVPKAATTCVCVHTSVDATRVLHITAVDPPGDSNFDEDGPSLVLIEGVCKLLLLLETIEQFRALSDDVIAALNPRLDGWSFSQSALFGGLIIGIPERYLRYERNIRIRLAVYLAVSEVIASPLFNKKMGEARKSLVQVVGEKLRSHSTAAGSLSIPQGWLNTMLNRIADEHGSENFLLLCAQHLSLDNISRRIALTTPEVVSIHLSQDFPYLLTTGGMYLQQRPQTGSIPPDSIV